MKKRKNELDVDLIGSQPSELTKEEEKMISEYIHSHKSKVRQNKPKEKAKV